MGMQKMSFRMSWEKRYVLWYWHHPQRISAWVKAVASESERKVSLRAAVDNSVIFLLNHLMKDLAGDEEWR